GVLPKRRLAGLDALDEPERLQRADAVAGTRQHRRAVNDELVLRQAVRTHGFEMQNVTSRPSRNDTCLARELHVAAKRRAKIVDVNVRFLSVVPEHDLLADPA